MKTNFLIPLIAGLGLLCACKGKGSASGDSSYEVARTGAADSVKVDSAMLNQFKLVKTAGMRFKVKNLPQTTQQITALTEKYNGMVIHHQMESTAEKSLDVRISNDSVMRVTSFNTTADLTVKIPSSKLNEFMNQVAIMGIYVNNRSMDITDKSLDYLSAQLKLKNRTELVDQQKKGKVVIKNPVNVMLLKDDMVDQQVGNRQIDDAVKNSIITLSLYQSNTINKEIIANDDPAAYNLPFFQRVGRSLANGWEIFVDVIVCIANLWVFIMAGISVWLIIRYYKGKKNIGVVKN